MVFFLPLFRQRAPKQTGSSAIPQNISRGLCHPSTDQDNFTQTPPLHCMTVRALVHGDDRCLYRMVNTRRPTEQLSLDSCYQDADWASRNALLWLTWSAGLPRASCCCTLWVQYDNTQPPGPLHPPAKKTSSWLQVYAQLHIHTCTQTHTDTCWTDGCHQWLYVLV